MSGLLKKYHICYIGALVRELYRNNDLQESTACTYVRSGVVLIALAVLYQDTYIFLLLYVKATQKVSYMLIALAVLFKDTYIFLLQYVRATQKVSYMLYK